MKKIIITLLASVVTFATFPFQHASATVIATTSNKASFGVKTVAINKIKGSNETRFVFAPADIVNSQNIAYWKVRLSCQKSIVIKVNESSQNACNNVVRLERGLTDQFSLLLENGGKSSNFSFKLKAYNSSNKWLHTEKQAFQWQ